MASFDFDYDQRLMTVLSPDITVTIQEMVNAVANEHETLLSLDDFLIAEWSGKDPLGVPGENTGITFKFLNGWQLSFAEFVPGPVSALVQGGNLLAEDSFGNAISPIITTVNVATIAQASSATFSEAQSNKQLQFAIESNAARTPGYKATGDVYYVDPVEGDDLNDGLLPARPTAGSLRGPKQTLAAAYALTESAKHDVIYLIQNQAGADTIITENIVIDKDDVHIRGQGKGLIIRASDGNAPTIQITGIHVSLRDFRVQGLAGGSAVACIECVGSEPSLDNINVENGDSHGVLLRSTADHYDIRDCIIHDNAGTGIRIEAAPDGAIHRGRVHDCNLGIHLQGTAEGHAIVDGTFIYDNTLKGIRIDAGFSESFITARTIFSDNGSGQTGGSTPEHDIENNEPTTTVIVKPADVRESVDRNAFLIEEGKGVHGWQGQVFYVDPINGNDNHAGTKDNPVQSFAAAQTLAVSGRRDLIILVSSGSVGVVEMDEQITITKQGLLVRGPGADFRWRTTSTGNMITVAAAGVELSGFALTGHTTGTGRLVYVNAADECLLSNLFLESAPDAAIELLNASNTQIRGCLFKGRMGGPSPNIVSHGVVVNGVSTASYVRITENWFMGVGGDGVAITNATNDTLIYRNIFHDGAGYGVSIAAGTNGAVIRDNNFSNNASGPWNDLAADSSIENNQQYARYDLQIARLEMDFTAQELIAYDRSDNVLQRWPVETDGGENVTTQLGVQTKRKQPILP